MKIETEGFGRFIHTALRKACDSPATSFMYNLIRALPDEAWADFARTIRDGVLARNPQDMVQLAVVMKEVWANMPTDAMHDADRTHEERFAPFYVLSRAAQHFDDNDWHGVCAFLDADRKW